MVEKVSWLEILDGEHVIVEINEVLGEVGNAMEVEFDGVRREGRQILLGDEIFVVDEG